VGTLPFLLLAQGCTVLHRPVQAPCLVGTTNDGNGAIFRTDRFAVKFLLHRPQPEGCRQD
jgi:hypothetical protein